MFKQISSNNPALWFRYNDLPIKSNIVISKENRNICIYLYSSQKLMKEYLIK